MTKPKIVFLMSALLLIGFMQIIIGMPVPLHYVFIILSMLLVFIARGLEMKINYACVVFLSVAAISIMSNEISPIFKPWQRYGLFAMMMLGCSPLLRGPEIDKVKRHLYMGGLWALGVIAALSFLGYFLGFGRRLGGIVNSYMGVAGHPNFLGFYTMVAMVWEASLFFRCTTMKERYIVVGGWIACVITLLLCSSRSALACGLVGTMLAVYLRYQKNATAMMNSILIGVAVVILSLPYLLPYAEVMMKKNMDFDNMDSVVADTRGAIWDLRKAELAESPIIGIGAYSTDLSLPNATVFCDTNTGTIELGSSYLGLLSQCGWLGFISFLLIVIPIIRKCIRYAFNERTPYAHLWLPILFVCAANMLFEGYLMTAGAVQCIIVWMAIGAADQCDKIADYPVAWESDEEEPITPEEYVRWRDANTEDR